MQNSKLYPIACLNCRDKHYKCCKQLPACSTCVKRGISCVYVPPKRKNRTSKHEELQPPLKQSRYSAESGPAVLAPESDNSESPSQQLMKLIYGQVERPLSPRIEEYNDMIQHALFCVHYATVFQRAPCIQDSPLKRVEEYYESAKRSAVKSGITYSLPAVISENAKLLTRSQMKKLSYNLFSKAKQTLLHPELYSCLPRDHRLTHLAINIASYLLSSGNNEKVLEARMLISAAELFMEHKGINILTKKEPSDELMMYITNEIVDWLTQSQLIILFQQFKEANSFSCIRDLFALGIQQFESKLKWSQRINLDILYQFKGLLAASEGDSAIGDLTLLYRFLQATQQHSLQAVGEVFFARQMGLLGGELLAIKIVSDQHKDNVVVTNILDGLAKDSARKLTVICREHFFPLQQYGVWNIWPYILASKANCRYADILLQSPQSMDDLNDHIGMLQANIIYLDGLYEKYDVEECAEVAKVVRQKVADICQLQMEQIQVNRMLPNQVRMQNAISDLQELCVVEEPLQPDGNNQELNALNFFEDSNSSDQQLLDDILFGNSVPDFDLLHFFTSLDDSL